MGLALSDALGLTARPLATLERANRRDDLRRLRELVRQHGVCRVVVGYPIRLDGTAGEMAAEVERFAARIEKNLGLPVELVDERLSSWEAQQVLAAHAPGCKRSSKSRGRRREPATDQVAAAVVLLDYLERLRAWRSAHAPAAAGRPPRLKV